MSGCGCEVELKDNQQKTVLYWLLAINATMFVFEIGFGWLSESTALIADSLDMLADAIVYAIALYAVGKSIQHKANAALVSGYFPTWVRHVNSVWILLEGYMVKVSLTLGL